MILVVSLIPLGDWGGIQNNTMNPTFIAIFHATRKCQNVSSMNKTIPLIKKLFLQHANFHFQLLLLEIWRPVTFQWTHWHFFWFHSKNLSSAFQSSPTGHCIGYLDVPVPRCALWCLNFQISWNEKTTANKFQFAVRQSLLTPARLSFYRFCSKG